MKIEPRLDIYERRTDVTPNTLRFIVVETFVSIDGYRSRVCEGRFGTLEAAQEYISDTRGVDNAPDQP